MYDIGSLREFERFLRLLAARCAQTLNMSTLATEAGVAVNTIKRWISILEACRIICLLPPYHNNLGKRITNAPKVYFLDAGLVCSLTALLDEEELASWNYAKDLDRQIRELKAENKDALKQLAKPEKQAAKRGGVLNARHAADASPSPGGEGRGEGGHNKQTAASVPTPSPELAAARKGLQPVLDQLAAWDATLQPYGQLKAQFAEARARFRTLTAERGDAY